MRPITITKTNSSKISNLDFNNIPLGTTFSDHMFICEYENGEWTNPRIEPLALIPTHPAAMALHYGQAIFEGMKATKHEDGTPLLFRPALNAARLNQSARRMGMPEFPEELFVEGLKRLVELEADWIPPQKGSALYLRPFMYADEAFIGMRASTKYRFIIMASPAGPFFSKPIRLYAETQYIRAVEGGTGEAKAAGNYAAAIRPTELAKAKGYDQVLWLDGKDFNYVQEVGTMNIFFKIDGSFHTPSLDGAILHGITRKSVIELLRAEGYTVTERPISIQELLDASQNGTLEEAFGTGTAVGIAMIQEIGYRDHAIYLPKAHPVGEQVLDQLNGIRSGAYPDTLDWMVSIAKEIA